MKEISVAASFGYYYEVLEYGDSFIAFDFDEELTEFVFTDLDTNLNSFYHQDTLTKLLDTEYITKEIEGLSTELRNYYFGMVDAGQWNAEGLTAKAPEWVELFAKIKVLKDNLDQYDKPLPEYLTTFINKLKAIPAEDFIAIGIFTNSNGPYLDDYFIELVLKNDVLYSIPSDFNNYYWCRVLENKLGFKMKFYLNNSVKLDSAIVWPTHLAGQKLYHFVPAKETNPFKWLLAKISGAYTKELTEEVKALFNVN